MSPLGLLWVCSGDNAGEEGRSKSGPGNLAALLPRPRIEEESMGSSAGRLGCESHLHVRALQLLRFYRTGCCVAQVDPAEMRVV